jgi:hypothetical protein
MKALPLILLLAASWAWSQDKQEPAKPEQRQQPQAPAKPLILRLDQLPASERANFSVHETPAAEKPQSSLPGLGGEPVQSYSPRRPVKREDADPIQ